MEFFRPYAEQNTRTAFSAQRSQVRNILGNLMLCMHSCPPLPAMQKPAMAKAKRFVMRTGMRLRLCLAWSPAGQSSTSSSPHPPGSFFLPTPLVLAFSSSWCHCQEPLPYQVNPFKCLGASVSQLERSAAAGVESTVAVAAQGS